MDKLFKLKQNGTTVRTEIIAGLTTFMTMAYIIALNPNLIVGFGQGAFGGFGADATAAWNGVFLATCLASAVAMFCMAFLANKPFALAPGMGLNSYFAVIIAQIAAAAGCTYLAGLQAGLCIILIEGIIFVLLSVFKIREKIVKAIPLPVRLGIGPGIGLMLMNIGFGSNAGVGAMADKYVMRDFFGALSAGTLKEQLGEDWPAMVLTVVTMFIGIFAIAGLSRTKLKNGAVLLGMLIASVANWAGQFILGGNPFASLANATWLPAFDDMAKTTLFKFDFGTLAQIGWGTVIILILTFCMIDMFDTIGTVIATANRAKMTDENGNVPKMREILLSDAIGTVAGAATGTSTVTTFIESASGVEAGGRTGLTSTVTGACFAIALFASPLVGLVPSAATAPILIIVGIMMCASLKDIAWDNLEVAFPCFFTLVGMPFFWSITDGIAFGFISYVIVKVARAKFKEVNPLMYVVVALFIIMYVIAGLQALKFI